MRKKEYNETIGRYVIAMAAAGVSQEKIVDRIDGITRNDIDRKTSLYRKDWQLGRTTLAVEACSAYAKQVRSGKCWSATKHFMACEFGIIEPKAPEVVINQPPIEAIRVINDTTPLPKHNPEHKVEQTDTPKTV